jgi:hypothetical protein
LNRNAGTRRLLASGVGQSTPGTEQDRRSKLLLPEGLWVP